MIPNHKVKIRGYKKCEKAARRQCKCFTAFSTSVANVCLNNACERAGMWSDQKVNVLDMSLDVRARRMISRKTR